MLASLALGANKKEINFDNKIPGNIWIMCNKKWTHPKFSGVVRNVGEKKWFPRKKAATKRGGCAQGA